MLSGTINTSSNTSNSSNIKKDKIKRDNTTIVSNKRDTVTSIVDRIEDRIERFENNLQKKVDKKALRLMTTAVGKGLAKNLVVNSFVKRSFPIAKSMMRSFSTIASLSTAENLTMMSVVKKFTSLGIARNHPIVRNPLMLKATMSTNPFGWILPIKKTFMVTRLLMGFTYIAFIGLLDHDGVEAATHSFDFDWPRQGAHCLKIAVGDSVLFQWDEWHNLKKLASESAYNSCDFAGGTTLAAAQPNPTGITVGPFTTAGDVFYSCSKICSSNGHKVRVCVGTDCACSEGKLITYVTEPTTTSTSTQPSTSTTTSTQPSTSTTTSSQPSTSTTTSTSQSPSTTTTTSSQPTTSTTTSSQPTTPSQSPSTTSSGAKNSTGTSSANTTSSNTSGTADTSAYSYSSSSSNSGYSSSSSNSGYTSTTSQRYDSPRSSSYYNRNGSRANSGGSSYNSNSGGSSYSASDSIRGSSTIDTAAVWIAIVVGVLTIYC